MTTPYKSTTKIEVRHKDETFLLIQELMASLLGKDRSAITEHIKNIFTEGKLEEKVVCREFQHTTGNTRKGWTQEIRKFRFSIKSPSLSQFRYLHRCQLPTQTQSITTQRRA